MRAQNRNDAMTYMKPEGKQYLETFKFPLVDHPRGPIRARGNLFLLLSCLIPFLAVTPAPCSDSGAPDVNHVELAAELMSAGNLNGAESEAKQALGSTSTRPYALSTLGEIRLRETRYREAVEFFQAALRINPGLLPTHMALADVFLDTGKLTQARKEFSDVLRLDPGNPDACFGLAEVESESGDFNKSLSTAEPILAQMHRSSKGIVLLANDYAGLQQKDALAGLVNDWSNLTDVSGNSSTRFASLLIHFGMIQQALTVLEKAKNSGQVSYEMAVSLGSLYLSKNNWNDAFNAYEAALSLKPNCFDCMLSLSKVALLQQDPEKALAYLIRAKRAQPDNAEVLFEFGKACLELDLVDDALPALQKASDLRPGNDSYKYVLASAQVSKKQYEVARKLLEGLLAKHPNDPDLNYVLGSLLFLEVKFDEAAKYLSRSVQLRPNQSAAYYYLGLVAEGKGDNQKAANTFRDVLDRDPQYGAAWEGLGRVLLNEKQYPEAKEALEKAVLLSPNSVKAHYQLGILLGRTGKQDEAQKQFEIVQQLNAAEEKELGMRMRIISPH